MTNPDRLTGLDASFLALEDAGAHMHVGSCLLFEGEGPGYVEFVQQLDSRMHPPRPRGRGGWDSPPLLSPPATTSGTPRCPAPPASSSCATWPGACSRSGW